MPNRNIISQNPQEEGGIKEKLEYLKKAGIGEMAGMILLDRLDISMVIHMLSTDDIIKISKYGSDDDKKNLLNNLDKLKGKDILEILRMSGFGNHESHIIDFLYPKLKEVLPEIIKNETEIELLIKFFGVMGKDLRTLYPNLVERLTEICTPETLTEITDINILMNMYGIIHSELKNVTMKIEDIFGKSDKNAIEFVGNKTNIKKDYEYYEEATLLIKSLSDLRNILEQECLNKLKKIFRNKIDSSFNPEELQKLLNSIPKSFQTKIFNIIEKSGYIEFETDKKKLQILFEIFNNSNKSANNLKIKTYNRIQRLLIESIDEIKEYIQTAKTESNGKNNQTAEKLLGLLTE